MAHGACEILENATHWGSLSVALANIDFSIATTARSRAKFRYNATQQRLALLQQRDTAKLHRLLHDVEKKLIDKNAGKK